MNRTLKEYLTKSTLETGGDWLVLLPLAFFRAWNTPYCFNLTPLEILDGGQTNLEISQEGVQDVSKRLVALEAVHRGIWSQLSAL